MYSIKCFSWYLSSSRFHRVSRETFRNADSINSRTLFTRASSRRLIYRNYII